MLRDAILRNVEIIGEAANTILKLDSDFEKRHPEMEPKAAYELRNALSHGYCRVDPVLIWGTARSDLPVLQAQPEAALKVYAWQ
jgi:uncharacterized protein with HEPN domain